MQKGKLVKIYQFDDFLIKKFVVPDLGNSEHNVDSYELEVKGLKVSLDFEGPLNVLPLEKGIYLIRGHDGHVLLRKVGKETAINQFSIKYLDRCIDYLDNNMGVTHHKVYTEFATFPYKFTMKMLQAGLIVLRVGCKYNLINFRNGKTLISGFDYIDERDGELIVEKAIYTTEVYSYDCSVHSFTYPSDILVGKLNSDYEIESNVLISQKFGIPVTFTKNETDFEAEYESAIMDLKDNPVYIFDCLTYQAENENCGRK